MILTHEYACPCHGCRAGRINARNTARGGGTRQAAMAISPTVRAAILAPFCERLKAAHVEALTAGFSPVVDATPPTYRRIIRAARKTRRPGAWAEIRRAVSEWLASPIMTRHDLIETAAAGLCMVAVTAAGVAMLLRMAVR